MQEAPQVGDKVRRLRRQRALPQADLAAAMGISASYLNLIEHNRRRVTVPLLFKLAGYFGLEPGELVESDDAQIAADLLQVFSDELFADDDVTNQEIRDLAHSNPVASRAVLRLFDRYRQLVDARASGLNNEPVNPSGHPATEAISDFIQENGSPICRFDFPFLQRVCTGKCPLFMTKEFVLQEGFGESHTIDDTEWHFPPVTPLVN